MFAFIKSKKLWSLSNDLAYGSLHDKVLFRGKKSCSWLNTRFLYQGKKIAILEWKKLGHEERYTDKNIFYFFLL